MGREVRRVALDEEGPAHADYNEAAHDAYFAAQDAGRTVANTAENLRFLLLSLYTSGYGHNIDPTSDRGQALLDSLLDAAEGRPFKAFDFRAG